MMIGRGMRGVKKQRVSEKTERNPVASRDLSHRCFKSCSRVEFLVEQDNNRTPQVNRTQEDKT